MNKNPGSLLIKNSLFSLFNTFFLMLGTWALSIWIARQLGPSTYGVFNLVLWFSGTFSWVVGMGLVHAVTKFVAECQGKGDRTSVTALIVFVLKIEVVFSLIVAAVMIFFQTHIADYFFSPSESFLFFLAALGLVPGVITAVLSATIEGIQKFEYFTWSSLIITPFSFGSKIAVLLMGKGITGLLVVMLIFSVINAIFYFGVLKREGLLQGALSARLGPILRKRLAGYNSSVMGILLCDKIVWDKSENFFLGRLCSAAEIGYYNLGFNVSKNFMNLLPSTFWRVLFPAMSSYFGSGDRDKMKRLYFVTTRYLAFVSFPVGVAGAILAYPILNYMYGRDFIEAQRALQIVFLCSILPSMNQPGSAILYGYEKQNFILKYGFLLAIVNIVLDLFLIKPYGAVGAAICYGITTTLASVGGLIYTCRTMDLKYPVVSIFKILFATVMMGIVMQLVLMRDREVVGSLVALAAGTVVYLVCALVLGTFEREDYTLLESVKAAIPGKGKDFVDSMIRFLAQFKDGSNGDRR